MSLPPDSSPPQPPACDCQLTASFRESREPWSWLLRRKLRFAYWRARRPWWRFKARVKQVLLGPASRDTSGDPAPTAAPCGELAAGDWVRVRPLAEIERMLDARGGCGGCAFLWPMRQYCGREFRVVRRVEHFFDEARWRMLRCRNVVLLEGVYCDGQGGHPDTLGCDRMCFFFWRTEWLERLIVSESAGVSAKQRT